MLTWHVLKGIDKNRFLILTAATSVNGQCQPKWNDYYLFINYLYFTHWCTGYCMHDGGGSIDECWNACLGWQILGHVVRMMNKYVNVPWAVVVVVVKWSECSPSTLTIRFRIPLTPAVFSVKFVFKKRPGLAHFKKYVRSFNVNFVRFKTPFLLSLKPLRWANDIKKLLSKK